MKPLLVALCSNLAPWVYSATTPLDQPLPPGQITTIACEYKAKGATYHYKVYVPEGYDQNPTRRYPAMFIFSPAGNAGMDQAKEWYAREKWVVIMMVESRNGPDEQIVGNLNAAYDDARVRLRLQPGLLFATGFSGGARCSTLLANTCPGFAGVILQGAGSATPSITIEDLVRKNIAVYMIIGQQDPNFLELINAKGQFGETPDLFACETHQGGHQPAPQEAMLRALEWQKEKVFLHAAPGVLSQEAVREGFRKRCDEIANAGSVLAKVDRLDVLLRLASKHGLDKDHELKDKVADLQKQSADLRKDPRIEKELSARDRYNQVRENEETTRKKILFFRAPEWKAGMVGVIQAYATIVRQYPDTEYGTKAEKKVEELTREGG